MSTSSMFAASSRAQRLDEGVRSVAARAWRSGPTPAVSAARFFVRQQRTERLGDGGQIVEIPRHDLAVAAAGALLEFVGGSLAR